MAEQKGAGHRKHFNRTVLVARFPPHPLRSVGIFVVNAVRSLSFRAERGICGARRRPKNEIPHCARIEYCRMTSIAEAHASDFETRSLAFVNPSRDRSRVWACRYRAFLWLC